MYIRLVYFPTTVYFVYCYTLNEKKANTNKQFLDEPFIYWRHMRVVAGPLRLGTWERDDSSLSTEEMNILSFTVMTNTKSCMRCFISSAYK